MTNILIILIIVLIISFLLIKFFNIKLIENFSYCENCGYKSRFKCNNCVNCGYCISVHGLGECVPGDQRGPYFREDCAVWEYQIPTLYYPSYYTNPYLKYYNFPRYTWKSRRYRQRNRQRNRRRNKRNKKE